MFADSENAVVVVVAAAAADRVLALSECTAEDFCVESLG